MSVIRCQRWKRGGRASEGRSGYGVSVLTTGWKGQKREGTHKSDEPVSKITWDSGGGSSGDVTHIEHLHGEGGSGLVQTWLPSVPTLMSPSGFIYLLRSLSNHSEAHSF